MSFWLLSKHTFLLLSLSLESCNTVGLPRLHVHDLYYIEDCTILAEYNLLHKVGIRQWFPYLIIPQLSYLKVPTPQDHLGLVSQSENMDGQSSQSKWREISPNVKFPTQVHFLVRRSCGGSSCSEHKTLCWARIVNLNSSDLLYIDLKMAEALYKLNINAPWPIISSNLLYILIVGLCAVMWRVRQYRKANAYGRTKTTCSDNKTSPIIPLEEFNWEETEQLQFRPFKGKDKYNLTMGEFPTLPILYKCAILQHSTHIQTNTS